MSPQYKVPLAGLAAKVCLADEWSSATTHQQHAILLRLKEEMTDQLRRFGARSSSFQTARSSLSELAKVITALQENGVQREDKNGGVRISVDMCFSCSLEEVVHSPQAAIVKLIVAEKLQGQCSLLLSERLAHEDEDASSQQQAAAAGPVADEAKSNSQRRRANRKKLLKKRRHDAEDRVTQQKLLKKALDELKICVRRKREQTLRDVSEILDDIVESAAAEAKPKVNKQAHTVLDLLGGASSRSSAKKRKKRKKSKKRDGDGASLSDTKSTKTSAPVSPAVAAPTASAVLLFASPPTSETSDNKENCSKQQTADKTPEARPLLSFLDKSYASPLSLPTFGPQPLYSSSTASPSFFLSLAPRELSESERSRKLRREELVAGDDRTSSNSAASSGSEHQKSSEFEWYLPSLFSSEASVHTNSAASSLDWDFNNWQLKNDSSTTRGSRLLSAGAGRLRTGPQAGTSSAAASKAYSLESFSDMLSASPSRRDPGSGDAAAGETSPAEVCSPESARVAAKSDFLYQQGGFFDRQRALKRRRRPLPFDYEEDDRCDSSGDGDDAWGEFATRSCCDCSCHNDRDIQACECKLEAVEPNQRSGKRRASDCKSSPSDNGVAPPEDAADVITRLAELEATLEEKSQVRPECERLVARVLC